MYYTNGNQHYKSLQQLTRAVLEFRVSNANFNLAILAKSMQTWRNHDKKAKQFTFTFTWQSGEIPWRWLVVMIDDEYGDVHLNSPSTYSQTENRNGVKKQSLLVQTQKTNLSISFFLYIFLAG
jgi:hypothetical protein